jgi:hypothetical protein
MKLDLRIRDLKTGDTSNKSFDNAAQAKEWLASRPRFMQALGVASHQVPHDVSRELKDAQRPLDDEERALEQSLDEAADRRIAEENEKRSKQALAERERLKKEMAAADPNRAMDVHYHFRGDIGHADPADERPISDDVRAAVLAWVAERNDWLKDRGQVVGDATLQVWPTAIPAGKEERVISGTFIPVTAGKSNEPN